MKRIYVSLGMAALGAASIQSVQGQSVDTSKLWSASASLSGFYDDNVSGVSSNPTRSFGFEVSPTLSLALPMEQTTISAAYTYSYKWYDQQVTGYIGHDEQTHTFAAQLTHTFSERLTLSAQESFVMGQEPDMLRVGNSADATLQPIPGDNIRNYAAVTLHAQITRLFGIEAGYANALYDYADRTAYIGAAALLNRLENTAHIDARWNLQPETVGLIGYQFSWVDYTGNLPIGIILSPAQTLYSDSRNERSHYVYVGLEHTFLPALFGSIKGGAQFTDYYNSSANGTLVSPYAQASLSYQYARESHVELGVSHEQAPTYQFSLVQATGDLTVDSAATVAYVSLTHRIVPKLFGSVIGTYQYATFNGGTLNNASEQFYTAGVNLEYRFTPHVSANVGYDYDKVAASTAAVETFQRNRVYIGATFAY